LIVAHGGEGANVSTNVMQPISSRLFRALRVCRDGVEFQFGAYDPEQPENPRVPDSALEIEAKAWVLDDERGPRALGEVAATARAARIAGMAAPAAPVDRAAVRRAAAKRAAADKDRLVKAAVPGTEHAFSFVAPPLTERVRVLLQRRSPDVTDREASLWARIVPPYGDKDIPRRPVAPTYLHTFTLGWDEILGDPNPLRPGTDVVLDFRTRLLRNERNEVASRPEDPDTSLCVVKVGDDYLLTLRRSDEIQGNILAGFSKNHQIFLFLNFGVDPEAENQPADARERAREWLKEQTDQDRIATTRQVTNFKDELRRRRDAGESGQARDGLKAVWSNLSLTYRGLRVLLADQDLDSLEPFRAFRAGPDGRLAGDTGDSAPNNWVVGGTGQRPVHAVVIVAADDSEDLRVAIDQQRLAAARHGLVVVLEQRGDALWGLERGHEHFGYRDGVSQPGIHDYTPPTDGDPPDDADRPGSGIVPSGKFVLGYPGAPAAPAWMHDGSFQVIRRLAQDVPGWLRQLADLAKEHPQFWTDRLGASLIGRWPDGTPLSLAQAPYDRQTTAAELNDFNYLNDPEGRITPRFAHIRRMRNRDGTDRTPRILRRGIPFGPAFDPEAGLGHGVDAERGLLFNAYMASIDEQFEQLQERWAHGLGDAAEDQDDDGPDPLIGLDDRGGICDLDGTKLDLRRVVQTTGTVYAFAPSLSTLKDLARGARLTDRDRIGHPTR
jgi:Dyp-type peroxidase family